MKNNILYTFPNKQTKNPHKPQKKQEKNLCTEVSIWPDQEFVFLWFMLELIFETFSVVSVGLLFKLQKCIGLSVGQK